VVSGRNDEEPVELNIGTDTVSTIITMARLFDSESELTEPDTDEVDAELSGLETGEVRGQSSGDSLSDELREVIDGLNDDEVIDLIALAWVGRGDFRRDDWEEARALARERHRVHSADYLMGMPALGDYLEEGLATLGHSYQEP
jgi:hypothetical protein